MNRKNDQFNLPPSWQLVRLGDFVNSEKGKKPKRENSVKTSAHYLPYIDIEAFESGVLKSWTDGENCKICNENDFLMVWDGSRSGLVGKGIHGALGSTLVKISFPQIHNNYAYYFLKSKFLEINTRAKGSGTPHVDPDLLWNYDFPVPPFAEQKRIVAKIEELFSEIDKGIENLLKAQELLKAYRQSILKNAFEGKLTKKWREENKENFKSTNPKTTTDLQIIDGIFPQLPKGWGYTQLGKLIEEPKYGTSKKCTYAPEGAGVLRIPNIVNGNIDTADLKFAQFDDAEKASYNLISGDILIIRSNGSISIVGKCALITENAEKYLFAGYLIRLRPYRHLIFPNFLASLLSSHFLRTQIENKAKSTSGVNNINSSELQSLLIPLCELEEQKVIVSMLKEYLSDTDNLEEEIQKDLHRLNALRQSVLKKAFSGKLVPQDATDESASILLERIKAEKEIPMPQKKKSKQLQKVAV